MKKKAVPKKNLPGKQKKRNDGRPFGMLMPLVPGISGLLLIVFGILAYYQAITSASWPSVAGVITKARVEYYSSSDSDGDTSEFYCISYNYTYAVDGIQFSNTGYCISSGDSCYSEEKEALSHQMEKGMGILVYYDPEKPSDSCIQRSEQITHIGAIPIILGFVFLVVSVVIYIGLKKESDRKVST